jgi:hypothetical protein
MSARPSLRTALLAAIAAATGLVTALRTGIGLDYPADAGPAVDALASGEVGGFLEKQPAMGLVSLLARAPLAAIAGSDLTAYRLGALVCVLAAAAVAIAVARRAPSWLAGAIVVGLAAAGPMTANALKLGHPEELMGAAFCVAAVLIAGRDRPLLAGAVLGLALGTKQWAVLAVLPVLIAAPRARVKLTAVAIVTAAVLWAPYTANPGELAGPAKNAAHTYSQVRPMSVWFPFAERTDRRVHDGVTWTTVPDYSLPKELSGVSHPLIVLLPLPLTLLLLRRRKERAAEHALGLLALVLLLRCALDPVDNGYYHVPFLLALGAWELTTRRGLPLISMLSSLVLWVVVAKIPLQALPTASAIYLAWAAAMAATLAWGLYGATRRAGRLVAGWPRSPSTASTSSAP